MADRVFTPVLSTRPPTKVEGLLHYVGDLARTVFLGFQSLVPRINDSIQNDGSEPMVRPLPLQRITVANLGGFAPADWEGSTIYVPDETGGPTLAFSDGTNWLRTSDNAVVS